MQDSHKSLFFYLMYLGALPFIMAALLLSFNITVLPLFGEVINGIMAYGLVIASFMAGVHWGQYLHNSQILCVNLFITSNICAIFLWLSYLLLNSFWFITGLIINFLLLLLIDRLIYKQKIINKLYFLARFRVTLIVCIALIILGIKLW